VVKQGDLEGLVIATGGNTFFGRTAKLVTGAGSVSHAQRAMFQIGNFLIVVALVLAMIMVGFDVWRDILIADSWRWADALNILEFVLILLVASIPVAMPAVFSITMALGELALSKQQAIVSKLSAIEEIAGVDILCSDKTGTLTKDQLTDCGTAVSGATDAARSAAALILTAPGRSVINDAIDEARRIFGRITSYTVYRVALTMDIMFLVVLSTILLGFKPLTAIMIVVLAIRDDAPIMAIAYDNTEVASKPIRWRMPRVLGVSACSACSRWSSRSGSCSSALRSWAGPRTRSSPSFSARSSCSRSCSCRSCWAVTSCFTAPGRPSGSLAAAARPAPERRPLGDQCPGHPDVRLRLAGAEAVMDGDRLGARLFGRLALRYGHRKARDLFNRRPLGQTIRQVQEAGDTVAGTASAGRSRARQGSGLTGVPRTV
jgi:hypothetical protein